MKLKRLEAWWKALCMRALAKLLPKAERGDTPDWSARPYRVLYLRYDRIGDMILATGLIRAIATSSPTITLDVLASSGNAVILDRNPHVGSVLIFEKRKRATWPALFRQLRSARYDAVIDGMVLAPSLTTVLLMLATGARYRIGVGGRSNDFIYTHSVPPGDAVLHVAEQSGRTAMPFGIDPNATDWRSELFVAPDERDVAETLWNENAERTGSVGPNIRLLVNISAAQPRHRWPDDRFMEVLRQIRARDSALRIVVTGTPAESSSIQVVAEACGGEKLVTGLRGALAMVATADLILTPDTSIAHAASAFRRPAVVMLRRRMAMFVPYKLAGRLVWAEGATLLEIQAGDVFEALAACLDEVKARSDAIGNSI
ncbi:MAG: glycosyltransferase family 9 protein [Gemmatimonadaceae bacterium]|nr:glycosyltransferase family 9 protein [Gemmatimonadaceae bacterium]MDQ3520333.1 glycosyltransferase family 9 protein [Gemmatimonadota bacterium]